MKTFCRELSINMFIHSDIFRKKILLYPVIPSCPKPFFFSSVVTARILTVLKFDGQSSSCSYYKLLQQLKQVTINP